MRKVVVFGGGTGISCLLSGLKLFPLDVTAVITVTDNGSSTGVLKRELDIPAVGDVGKVLLAMANVDDDFVSLLRYRFSKEGSLYNHPVRNILLAALIDLKGNLTEATKYMAELLRIKGTVLPLTEDKVELVGKNSNQEFYGEEEVSANVRHIRRLSYDHSIHVVDQVTEKIAEADLIIFSPGSLYTSILPHLLAPEVCSALAAAKAPILYVCNLVTQPGETDGYSVGDHLRVLNQYLKKRHVDVVLANNSEIDPEIREYYLKRENKRIVNIDPERIEKLGAAILQGGIFCVDEAGSIRHDALKTAFIIFSYVMNLGENES